MGSTDVLSIVNGYPIAERILLVEAILKRIREENEVKPNIDEPCTGGYPGTDLVEFAGILNDREAAEMEEAIVEARKIDKHEW